MLPQGCCPCEAGYTLVGCCFSLLFFFFNSPPGLLTWCWSTGGTGVRPCWLCRSLTLLIHTAPCAASGRSRAPLAAILWLWERSGGASGLVAALCQSTYGGAGAKLRNPRAENPLYCLWGQQVSHLFSSVCLSVFFRQGRPLREHPLWRQPVESSLHPRFGTAWGETPANVAPGVPPGLVAAGTDWGGLVSVRVLPAWCACGHWGSLEKQLCALAPAPATGEYFIYPISKNPSLAEHFLNQ